MKAVSANGAAPGPYFLLKRRVFSFLVLACFLLSIISGDFLLPPSVQAAPKKAAQTAANASGKKKNQKTVIVAKKKRTYARSLAPDDERAALRERGISSGFGPRVISRKCTRLHKGIDVPAPKDSKIVAFNDGEILFVGNKSGYGKVVIVKQIDGREALYAHMNKFAVKVGDNVKRGDHIGHVGRTGRATGYHLHFEMIDEGVHLDPAFHVWHGSELVLGPGDFDPDIEGQTKVASPNRRVAIPLH